MSLATAKECGPCDMLINDLGPGAQGYFDAAHGVLSGEGRLTDGECPVAYLDVLSQTDRADRATVGAQIAHVMQVQGGAL